MKAPALKKVAAFDFKRLVDDFRQLDPNDPGLWPAAPRVAALVALFILLLVGAWWFLWKGQLETLDERRSQEVQLREEWVGKKRQAVNLDEYRKQLADIDRQFGTLLKQLPNKSEMEALLVDVNQAGRGRGLSFELWKPGTEAVRDFYAELPIALRVTGSYDDLGNFASDVAKLPRIVTLSDMAITMNPSGKLMMDANAVTYRYLDEEEIAKQRREKAAQKK
ncbi:type 4a pilus biogenesis protein PilO [Uliginosibacterium sp. sgz301328]|uniref:type 4a pilus biogenesis protein PilO n=1 Tax=Uliginosibacterium sp. sgz301328 TaxID=3243764 RepID=UPI00359EE226